MLLYSTTLKINDSLTGDKFISLVIEWNQKSPHKENVIPNLNWNGEHNVRFGNEWLWMDIEEYRNKNIIAVRYEKKEADGAVWDTDYVMNFDEMKMAIRLDRSYTEDALMENPSFLTPHFLTLLIENGYVVDDYDLPILRKPILINNSNLDQLTGVINGRMKYRLPVVYVSKTVYNKDPLNCSLLCSKLKGAAHVLLQQDKSDNYAIRTRCNDSNEYFGGIGIYFPNGNHRRYIYREYDNEDSILMNKVANAVFRYMNMQITPPLYTWAGVNNSLLRDKWSSNRAEKMAAETARQHAEAEFQEYQETFDQENVKLQSENDDLHNRIEELTRDIYSLQQETQGLRAKLSDTEDVPIIFLGDEEEFYQGEIREMVLDAVDEKLKNTKEKTRRYDVYQDILKKNNYQGLTAERIETIKNLLKDYKTMSGTLRQQLMDLGFVITEEGKHYRLTYYGDGRYKTTFAKTGSDHREGRNNAAIIAKNMF